jgi:Leucine-rich repeat (LRR) protein
MSDSVIGSRDVKLASEATITSNTETVEKALELLRSTTTTTMNNIVVNNGVETSIDIVAFLSVLRASQVRIGRLALIGLQNWNDDCTQELRLLLQEKTVHIALRGTVMVRTTVLFATPTTFRLLRTLDFSHCLLGDPIVEALFPIVAQLECLILTDNRLSPQSVPALCELLQCGAKSLQSVALDENALSSEGEFAVIDVAARKLRHLTKFNAEFQRCVAKHIANREVSYSAYKSHDYSTLVSLALEHLSLTEMAPLEQCQSLESLLLGHNSLRSLSHELMLSLTNATRLTLLDLCSNRLTSLPASLAKLTTLCVLDVQHNRIGNLPLFLFDGLSPESLNLSSNRLRTWPAALNVESLADCRQLLLAHNSLRDAPFLMLGAQTRLEYLSLRNNALPQHCAPENATEFLRLLRCLAQDARRRAYPVRVVFLGAEEVGKST